MVWKALSGNYFCDDTNTIKGLICSKVATEIVERREQKVTEKRVGMHFNLSSFA